MAGSGEGVRTTLKWCREGAEICCFDKTGKRQCFEKARLNHHFTSPLNDDTEVNMSVVTREDSVLELNTFIKMHMSNGSRVEQRNCTEVQLNHATAGELITFTKVQLKNNNAVVNLNDGTMIHQNNLTTGQLMNNGTTVQWYNEYLRYNHADGPWYNNKTEELVNGATWLWYNSPIVRGWNVTMMHW